jgi:hypothetical protein
MDQPPVLNSGDADANLLVENDGRILELVRKDLSQEYLRLVTRAMQASASVQASDPTLPAALKTMNKRSG